MSLSVLQRSNLSVRRPPTVPIPNCWSPTACPCTENPFANLSAEGPDRELFVESYLFWLPAGLLDWDWRTLGFLGQGASTSSQDDAHNDAATDGAANWASSNAGTDTFEHAQGRWEFLIVPNDPIQLTFVCPTYGYSSIYYYTLPAGSVLGTSKDDANRRAQKVAQQRMQESVVCLLTNLPEKICTSQPVDADVVPIGANVSRWEVVQVPPGLHWSVNADGLQITGQIDPSVFGVHQVIIRAYTDTNGYAELVADVNVLSISPSELPIAAWLEYYECRLAAQGFTGQVLWYLIDGRLPRGLVLSPDGIISGIPEVREGTYPISLLAVNEAGTFCVADYILTVIPHTIDGVNIVVQAVADPCVVVVDYWIDPEIEADSIEIIGQALVITNARRIKPQYSGYSIILDCVAAPGACVGEEPHCALYGGGACITNVPPNAWAVWTLVGDCGNAHFGCETQPFLIPPDCVRPYQVELCGIPIASVWVYINFYWA